MARSTGKASQWHGKGWHNRGDHQGFYVEVKSVLCSKARTARKDACCGRLPSSERSVTPCSNTIPNINHVADRIGGAKWYSTFDLCKSFFQVIYDKESSRLTAFTVNSKRYIFKKMVMGHLSDPILPHFAHKKSQNWDKVK